jgi:hypothetical protein
MRMRLIAALTALVLATAIPQARGQELAGQVRLNAAADEAIDRGVAFLWKKCQVNHWQDHLPGVFPRDRGYVTALCAYALLTAGQSHQSPPMAATLEWLARADIQGVYAHGFRALALSLLPATSHRTVLEADVRYLISAMREDGSFGYEPPLPPGGAETAPADEEGNNAATQVALAAVSAAASAGVEVPEWFWRRAQQHWINCQTAQGGWTYASARAPAYGSMTAAGLASLYLCQDVLARQELLPLGAARPPDSAQRGLTWLAEHFTAFENPGRGPQYYHPWLWCVERAARASGRKHFGVHNWFAEGAGQLIRRQEGDGQWEDEISTSFALLFLARARQPVLFSKLAYAGNWDIRPNDLSHLADWFGRTFETSVRWQVLDINAPAEDWYDAPILYISGLAPPVLTDKQAATLRAFVLRGGLIWSETAGNNAGFDRQMRQWYARLLPEWPLKAIPPEHRIYSARAPLSRPLPMLGISNGVRLLAVHVPVDLSRAYQTYDTTDGADAFALAANLYFHVGDPSSLRRRGQPFLEPLADGNSPPPAAASRTARRRRRPVQASVAARSPEKFLSLDGRGWPEGPGVPGVALAKPGEGVVQGGASPSTAPSPGLKAHLPREGGGVIPQTQPARRTIHLAVLQLPGGDVEPLALERLAASMARQCQVDLAISRTPIEKLGKSDAPIALLSSTQAFTLDKPQRASLRAFINAGGLVVADALGGSATFDAAARNELLTLLDDAYPQIARLGATSEAIQQARWPIGAISYRRAARAIFGQDDAPQLQAVSVAGRAAIIYSRDDLTAGLVGYRGHDFRGYAPASAYALVRNLILYAADRPPPPGPLLKGSVDVEYQGQ